MTIDLERMTDAEFEALPLVVEGESKIVRDAGDGMAVIRFKPTIYSFSSNRAGVVPGSDSLRLGATRIFVDVLRSAAIDHAYLEVGERFVRSRLIADPPPIEVVVKAFHSGTSKHRYVGMSRHPIRASHPFYAGMSFGPDDGYPVPLVRFDWRNPLRHPETGARLADEVLGDGQADWFIDVAAARKTAAQTYQALASFLAARDIVLYDLCLFVTHDGRTVFGEISQDCGRFRHFDLGSLDKDVWRAGGSSEHVLEKWALLLKLISQCPVSDPGH
jgi:phosphoribosylaminoimidazole-succinocarboxamide synthase